MIICLNMVVINYLHMRPLSLLLVLIMGSSLAAQRPTNGRPARGQGQRTLQVKGQIIDQATTMGLEFATVSIFRSGDSTLITGGLADLDGKFSVDTRPGPQYAVVEFIGYDQLIMDVPIDRQAIRAAGGVIDLGTLALSAEGIELEGVTVRAERSETQFSLDKRVFNVGQDLANQGGSAQDILDNVPSVTVDVEGEVSLRGSNGVRILIDGKPSGLANQDNANGLRAIPANLIESVEVITNPSSRYEAEGMAGIINIILKKDKGSGFNGSFDVNAGYPLQAGLGANVNYRKGNLNWF
ncbi:MAG: TonB-dependent receptor plug domain-containing protein, partial [Bacteroidota bacterium]